MADTQQDQISVASAFKPLLDSTKGVNRRVHDLEASEGTKLAPLVSTTASVVVNSAAVNNLFVHALPGNTLRTNQIVHGYVPFVYLNSTVGVSSLKFGVLYGGLTILNFDAVSPTNNAANRPGHLELYLWGNGLETTQAAFGRVVIGPVIGSPTTDQFEFFAFGSLASIDSSLDQDVTVTVQHGTADPNIKITGELILLTGPYIP